MRKLLITLAIIVLAIVGLQVAVNANSPSSEVVTLTSVDASGQSHDTLLWIVEDEGALWLRAGHGNSDWINRLRANGEVQLERGGEVRPYRAILVESSDTRARVNGLMSEKYGASDTLISTFARRENSIPIRLEPSTAVGAAPR